MIKKLFKRTIAVMLTICIALSTVTFSVSAGSFTNFGINKLYTTGFLIAGKTLTSIAGATKCEELEKMASFINVWVCGGNTNAQNFAKIEELCQEILTEVKKIEQKQDSYASYFSTQQAKDKYDALVKEMNTVWTNDVENVLAKESISTAMLDYFEYEDMTPKSNDDKNQHIGYVAAASCYKNNTPDKYGHYYTFDEVQALREDLFDDFCTIHGKIPSTADTIEKKANILFSSTDVDSYFQTAIRTLSDNINKADSYSDICAQVAYQSMPNLADQYEYVMTGMNKQFMEVIMVEMLYQEYLSMRGEYLEKYYPDNTAKWNSYRKDGIEKLEYCNEELLGIMENRVSKPLQLSTNIKLSIDKYVRPEDVSNITLKNIDFTESRRLSDEEDDYSIETKVNLTKEYMNFVATAIPTQNGIKMYYLFNEDAEILKTKNLVYKEDFTFIPWGLQGYGANCDAYNFRFCTYSDGHNSFSNPEGPSGDKELFQTGSFAFYGSEPYAYLVSQYLDDGEEITKGIEDMKGKKVYRMYANSCWDCPDGVLTDSHMIFDTLDMTDSYVGFDTSLDLVEKVDSKVVYEKDYTNKHYDKAQYDSYFNVILNQDKNEIKHKLSYAVTGDGKADLYITKRNDGTKVSSGSTLNSGEDLTLWLKTVDESVYMDSVNMSKYNDYQNPNTPTSTQTLLGQDEISNLELDEATGYYKVDFTMPYSDTKLELTTVTLPNSLDDENGNYVISSYDDLCQMSKMVSSGYETYVNGTYVLTSDIDCSGKTEFVPVGQTGLYHSANPSADGNWGFKGTFDGQGHVIKNLSITGSFDKDLSYGIFGTVSGTVKNLGVENLTYTGAGKDSRVGGIAGQVLRSGTITDCYVNNSNINTQVNTQNGVAGGIAGANYSGTIENCYTYNVNITAGRSGGIVGDNHGDANNANGTDRPGTIKNCVTTSSSICKRGSATDSLSNVSINTFKSGEVTYRLNNGVTDGTQAWYQSVDNGLTPDDYPVLVNNDKNTVYKVNLKDKTYSNTPATPIKLDTKINEGTIELSNNNPMPGDSVDITINAPEGYYIEKVVAKYHADGSEETISGQILDDSCTLSHVFYSDATIEAVTKRVFDVDEYGNFIIRTYDDLCTMANMVNSGKDEYVKGSYIVVNDITAPENSQFTTAQKFSGTFDGQGHTIFGLNIASNTDNAGLFGTNSGTIKNLVIANSSITGVTNVGLCGRNYGTIENVGSVDNYISGNSFYVGGVVGCNAGGTVRNCYNTGEVNLDSNNSHSGGGVVGRNSDGGTVTKCYNTGKVYSYQYAGGVVGYNTEYSIVENCYNTGAISALLNAGGVVGYSSSYGGSTDSIIENCYNIGEVTAGRNFGGIVGYSYAQVRNCYNIETINAVGGEGSGYNAEVFQKTAEQFKSGKVAYSLNKEVTDGTQAWYQNIVGENADAYPVLDSTHNTVYKSNDTYTNGDLIGDINCDGTIDEADLLLLGEYLIRKEVLTLEEVTVGDVNGDGKTGPNDLAILKAYVNQEDADYGNVGKYGINNKPSDALLVGDATFDGMINQSDADLLSQFNVEMTDLTDEQKKAGDIDLDGHISSKDMSEINKYLAIVSNGGTYTGNIGKYSYKGFDMNITLGDVSSTTPEGETVPAPDNSDANSSTSDSVTTGKTDSNTVKTGNPVNCIILLSVLISGFVLVFTFRRYKNK